MITKGKGKLGRIYERLRKRSYRSCPYIGTDHYRIVVAKYADHLAYVRGVKDALQAVEQDLLSPVKK